MKLRSLTMAGLVVAGALTLAGCNLGGDAPPSKPYSKISECWGPGVNTLVSNIIQPHLTKQVDDLLTKHEAPASLLRKIGVSLSLSNRHPINAKPLIGEVTCSATVTAKISGGPGYASVTLNNYSLAYRIFPARNDNSVVETMPAALDDALSAHEDDIVTLAKAVYAGKPTQPVAPASQASASATK